MLRDARFPLDLNDRRRTTISCEIIMQKRELNQLVLDLWRRLRIRKGDAATIRQEMQEAELSLQEQKSVLERIRALDNERTDTRVEELRERTAQLLFTKLRRGEIGEDGLTELLNKTEFAEVEKGLVQVRIDQLTEAQKKSRA